jgi:hypothetical protein
LGTPIGEGMATRTCSKCGVEKDISEFRLRNRFTGRRQSYCNDCGSQMGKDWYERNKDYQKQNASKHRSEYQKRGREYIWDYLSTHPCIKCGESDPHALEFHHARGAKVIEVSRLVGRGSSLEMLKAEIEKCDVLCANCHRKLTAKEQGWFRGRQ